MLRTVSLAAIVGLLAAVSTQAEETVSLLNGKDLSGWMNAAGDAPGKGWQVEDGVLVRVAGAGDIWTKERYGDFILSLEFQTEGNSGVFFRTDNPRDNVQTGLEIQVHKPSGPNKHSVGALYDALPPTQNAAKEGWNKMQIMAKDNVVKVTLNGEQIIEADLDKWSTAGKNPDGSKNKYRTALKDFKREGHIGFQDHGAKVMYRNVKLTPLK